MFEKFDERSESSYGGLNYLFVFFNQSLSLIGSRFNFWGLSFDVVLRSVQLSQVEL